MKREPIWLDRRALLLLHGESAAGFGGAEGVRDEGLLDSALQRPPNRFQYEGVHDLAELAAAYGYGLAKNHPFVDGDKRVAFVAIGVFLAINGKKLNADPVDAIRVIVVLAAGELDEPALAKWIGANITKAKQKG